MAQARKVRRETEDSVALWLTAALREALFWLTAALAVVLAVALASFHPGDPSFTSTGTGAVRNLIGPAGAWTSDVLLLVLGLSAYILPVLLAYCGWMIFRGLARHGMLVPLLRIAAFLLALLALSTLLTLLASPGPGWLPGGIGGILGYVIGTPVTKIVGETGAGLLLLAVLLAGVTLATGLSWIALMDRLGSGLLRVYGWVSLRGRHWQEGRAARADRSERVAIVEREVRRRKSRPQPRIEPSIAALEPGPRAQRERQRSLFISPETTGGLPPLELLDPPPARAGGYSEDALAAMSRQVELKLRDFGVEVEVVAVYAGPVITRFELQPAAGVKVSQIS
ncbi:MAG TPA: DNA translocase FtsK 4TM domain-containing protein, partial [Gammaproteobacteria bacterium]|nr:DNA translocase FtsK 4TM domain-containing protein [Gammaproteobacteria bacterium]